MGMKRSRIQRDLDLPADYELRSAGSGGHLLVIRPDGQPLRLGGLPLQVACSPGDNRTRTNERARIRRALREKQL